jgi:hypothetical protein
MRTSKATQERGSRPTRAHPQENWFTRWPNRVGRLRVTEAMNTLGSRRIGFAERIHRPSPRPLPQLTVSD